MPSSSRPTLSPISRAPSSRSFERGASGELWQRQVALGALVSLALSLIELAAFRYAGGAGEPWQAIVLSLIFTAALVGLALSGVAVTLGGLVALATRRPRLTLRASGWIAAVGVAAYSGFKLLAVLFGFHASSRLSIGALEFLVGGLEFLSEALLRRYPFESTAVVCLAVFALLVSARLLMRPVDDVPEATTAVVHGLFSLGVTVSLLVLLSTPDMARPSGLTETAELSLLSSFAERQRELGIEAAAGVSTELRGPSRREGALWDMALPSTGPRPNVVLVMLESVGTDHLGFRGYERPTTPHLDRIANQSARFDEARTTATHSNYAQMAVLSSLFPRRFSGLDTYRRLDYPRVLWHDVLSQLGYQTATYSSQDENWQGMLRFQTTETPTEIHHAGTYTGRRLDMVSEKIVPDNITVQRAITWMERQSGPFGLYVNLQSTHFPYRLPPGARHAFTPDRPKPSEFFYLKYPESALPTVINKYDSALSFVDSQVGRLWEHLESSGQLENTIFIVTSDHGELFLDHGTVTHGRTLLEGEARVPLLISWPGHIEPSISHRPASTLDVLPTLTGLLGLLPHPAFQGENLMAAPSERGVFANIQGMKAIDSIVCGPHKLVVDRGSQSRALFDLSQDPGERRNLVESRADVAAALHQVLSSQMRAQLRYHAPSNLAERERYYAPRLGQCPGSEPAHLSGIALAK